MANYYKNFSFLYGPFSNEIINDALCILHELKGADLTNEDLIYILADQDQLDFCYECCDNSLWFYSNESGDTEQLTRFLEFIMNKHDLPPVGFEISFSCSKPRIDAFGGAALWITKKAIYSIFTRDWILEKQRNYSND